MPMRVLPKDDALKKIKELRDLLQRFEYSYAWLFSSAEQKQLAEAIKAFDDLQAALKVPGWLPMP